MLKSQKNQSEWWKTIKNIGIHSKKRNDSISEYHNSPDEFNMFFTHSAPILPIPQGTIYYYENSTSTKVNSLMSFKPFTQEDLLAAVRHIKSNVAGNDSISLDILKLFMPHCSQALLHIFNNSINSTTVPSQWKISVVLPLAKKADPKTLSDYRPISILNVLSKILERLVYLQLLSHIKSNEILPANQSGFREGFSTVTSLLDVTDLILKSFDESKITTAVFLDYTKAFDSINHRLLTAKLHFFGLDDNSVAWFQSYLSDRFQKVKIVRDELKSFSGELAINAGVPQGSILGPILFALYISDLPEIIEHTTAHYFADDCQLLISYNPHEINDAFQKINDDLDKILNFSRSHSLQLNPAKSKYVNFHSKYTSLPENDLHISLDGQGIEKRNSISNLGIIFDETLSFHEHITKLNKICYLKLKQLYHFKPVLSTPTKLKLVESLIFSVLWYADVVFGPCLTSVEAQRIQKIQNSCIRFATTCKMREHISPFYQTYKILTMKENWQYHLLCLVHKVIRFNIPPYLRKKLVFRSEIHQTALRHVGETIHVPKHRTEMYKSSFSYTAGHYYNKIPMDIRQQGLQKFKNNVKNIFFSNQS